MANTSYLTPLGGYSDAGAIMLRNMAANAELLTEYLRFQGRVFKHPASVALEFFTQKPGATFIATAAQWEKAGLPLRPAAMRSSFSMNTAKRSRCTTSHSVRRKRRR